MSVIVLVALAEPSAVPPDELLDDPPVAIETWPEPTLMVEESVLDTVTLLAKVIWLLET